MDVQLLSNGEYGFVVLNSFQMINVMIGNQLYVADGNEALTIESIYPNYNNLEINILYVGENFELATLSLQTLQVLSTYTISSIPFNEWSIVKLNSSLFVYGGNNLTGGMGNVFNVDSMSIIQSTKLPLLNINGIGSPFLPLGVNLQSSPIVSGFVFTHLVAALSYPVVLANYKGDYVTVANVESFFLFEAGFNKFYVGRGNFDAYLFEVDSFTSEEKLPKPKLRKHIEALLHDIDIVA